MLSTLQKPQLPSASPLEQLSVSQFSQRPSSPKISTNKRIESHHLKKSSPLSVKPNFPEAKEAYPKKNRIVNKNFEETLSLLEVGGESIFMTINLVGLLPPILCPSYSQLGAGAQWRRKHQC
jgi:hypothetical protein